MRFVYLAAFILSVFVLYLVPVQAQSPDLPKTIKLHNNKTGEHLGTITLSGNRAYMRNKDGEHTKTIVQNPDGSTTTFDPHGNIIANPK